MSTIKSRVFTGKDSLTHLSKFLSANSFSQTFVLVDENTLKHCYPKIKKLLPKHSVIQIKSREKNKTLDTCELVWNKMTAENADRKALLINLGGGVIGDLGGFAAGCYKRGIKFINIPTTLLAMVDASVGAKTGVDFKGFKNQIGLFNEPEAVFIHTGFLKTLPDRDLKAGLAEVIKHYLIADAKAFKELFDLICPQPYKPYKLSQVIDWDKLVEKNVAIKAKIVAADKFETGERKALNFGHTVGHAVETYFLSKGKDILHGEAIAIGLLCESSISIDTHSFPRGNFAQLFIINGFLFPDSLNFSPQAIPVILRLMKQDKKNTAGKTRFTLLKNVGSYSIDNTVDEKIIINALSYYSEITRVHKIR